MAGDGVNGPTEGPGSTEAPESLLGPVGARGDGSAGLAVAPTATVRAELDRFIVMGPGEYRRERVAGAIGCGMALAAFDATVAALKAETPIVKRRNGAPRHLQEVGAGAEGEPAPVALSDDALAEWLVQQYGEDWRYTSGWNMWLRWDGATWREDTLQKVKHLALQVCRASTYWPEAASLTIEARRKINSVAKAGSVLTACSYHPSLAATVDQWDTDPWLLGVPGGVVDLRSGELLDGVREHYIRQQATVMPADPEAAEAPEWTRFLERVQPDPDVRGYLRRLAGYCLTGSTREHVLAFMYGGGANGKSTFINALSGVMGDYAKVAAMSTFSDTQHGHPEEIARLQGARIVSAEETGSGARWDEARIKELTGATAVTAHFMRSNSFSYVPCFKLVFAGNHLPKLKAVSEGMRRRLHLVPWSVQIPDGERDVALGDKLKAEAPAILRWAIGGCLDYQLQGLNPPACIVDAGKDYMADEDTIGRWRLAATEDAPGDRVQSSDLYRSYRAWMEGQEEKPVSQRAFSEGLTQSGCSLVRAHGVRYIKGLRLRAIQDRMADAPPVQGRDWEY